MTLHGLLRSHMGLAATTNIISGGTREWRLFHAEPQGYSNEPKLTFLGTMRVDEDGVVSDFRPGALAPVLYVDHVRQLLAIEVAA